MDKATSDLLNGAVHQAAMTKERIKETLHDQSLSNEERFNRVFALLDGLADVSIKIQQALR